MRKANADAPKRPSARLRIDVHGPFSTSRLQRIDLETERHDFKEIIELTVVVYLIRERERERGRELV